jgi:dienelactone hydrolase
VYAIEWTDPVGSTERSFRVTRLGRTVPGVLWMPAAVGVLPGLILLGHGGSGHKRSERLVRLGRWFAEAGLAAVAIDGPYHGERAEGLSFEEGRARMAAEGADAILDGMAGDWRATVEALSPLVDSHRLAYLGMSMGTRFGIPAIAGMSDRFRCVVLGKFGLSPSPVPHRIAREAALVTAPMLFHIQWHDELFPRSGQLALFERFASRDKHWLGYAGAHAQTHPSAEAIWRSFILDHFALRPASARTASV